MPKLPRLPTRRSPLGYQGRYPCCRDYHCPCDADGTEPWCEECGETIDESTGDCACGDDEDDNEVTE